MISWRAAGKKKSKKLIKGKATGRRQARYTNNRC